MVECGFSDPQQEQAWNDYYTQRKLDEVLAVPGFRTSQRFKAIVNVPAPYLAIHTVDSLDVLTGEAYRSLGGGSFDRTYQGCITNWHRNLFDGLARAPAIAEDEFLAVTDEVPAKVAAAGVEFSWLRIAGLDASTPQRGIARIDRMRSAELAKRYRSVITVFAPLMPQRQELPGKRPH
jgi:hypothetical protein